MKYKELIITYFNKYKNNKKVIVSIVSSIALLLFIILYSLLSSGVTKEQEALIQKTFYNEKNEYIWTRIRWVSLNDTNSTDNIPSKKILLLLTKKKEELTESELSTIRKELNDETYWLKKEEALNITKTTVLIDSSLPYIEEFKKKTIDKNPYEEFIFLDINSSEAKTILKDTDEKYISTPIFLYWDKNPNIALQEWKKYFYPRSEDLSIIHTVTVNKELISTLKTACKDLTVYWKYKEDELWFLAIWRKGLYRVQKMYDDLKLLDKSICFIPEEKDIDIINDSYVDEKSKLLKTYKLLEEELIKSQTVSEKNKELLNKIKLINAVLKNKSEFYLLDEQWEKLYMLDKIQFKQ